MVSASPWRRPFILYPVLAFLVFLAGYLLFYGRLASISGSWDYVMRTSDDSLYWITARSLAQGSPGGANPFYAEAAEEPHAIPYPAVTGMAWLSKGTGLPVLTFFPLWYIGMPLLLWWTLFWCLTRIWRYPPGGSAFLALFLLLVTLYFRGVPHNTILRYPHPGDALWALFLWISLAMNPETGNPGRRTAVLAGLSALTLWVDPYLAVPGMAVMGLEMVWQFIRRAPRNGLVLLTASAACLLAAAGYGLYVRSGMPDGGEGLRRFAANGPLPLQHLEMTSLAFYGLLAVVVLGNAKWQKKISRLDRLVLFLFLAEPLCGNIELLLPPEMLGGYHRHNFAEELSHHRYSYLVVEMAVLIGWLLEKMPVWRVHEKFRHFENAGGAAAAVLAGVVLWAERWTFLRFAPNVNPKFGMPNPDLLWGLLPFLVLGVWLWCRSEGLRRRLRHPAAAASIILAMVFTGYPLLAGQTYAAETHNYIFRDFPFSGAYRWLNQHAKPGEVVLTAPPSRLDIEYLLLHTDLKTYVHPFGNLYDAGSAEEVQDHTYRFLFYFNLLADDLRGFVYRDTNTLEEKLTRLKLDYILAEINTPFLPHMLNQLHGYVKPVYRDRQCLLLKVQIPRESTKAG